MITMYRIFILSVLCLCLMSSCNELLPTSSSQKDFKEGMKVLKVEFSPDYKHFFINVKMVDNIGTLSLTDTSLVTVETKELEENLDKFDEETQPVLTEIKNIRAQELAAQNLNVLVLVDLTLSEECIEAQREAIQKMRTWFINRNLYVAFMRNDGVSESMLASDYVLANYFRHSPSEKYLYRSILKKVDELEGIPSRYYPEVRQDTLWKSLSTMQKALIVFSDGNIYERNRPIDPKHFELQREIIQRGDSLVSPSVYYVNFGTEYEEGEGNEVQPFAKLLCKNTDGIYMNTFDWNVLLADMLQTFDIEYADYQFCFVNPDNKIYRGAKRYMQIECFHNGKYLTGTRASYMLGSVYNPVIVNGRPVTQIVLHGFLMSILLIILVYLVCQLLIPYIRYQLFKRKYVTHYTKQNMTFNGILVDQSCYFCKAPFEEGDEIVVKCQHVLHKSCWDENEYKCPEYGHKCKEGSHFYNSRNLFDFRNASFYMKWIITGIVAGLAGWVFFLAFVYRDTSQLINNILLHIYELQPGTPEAIEAVDNYGSHLYYLPFYGMSISFFLTLFLCFLSSRRRQLWEYVTEVVVKAIVAGAAGYVAFLLGCIISIALDLEDNTFLVDWIPWSLSGFIIAFVVTYRTEIKLRKSLILISIFVGLGSMYIWSYLFYLDMNSREQLLLSYVIYSVGMAVSIAAVSPRSERYFLRVEGPIKGMDIALYKWMNTSPDYRVSIGKSVNCSLQMSWDLNSDIAPLQAEIVKERGTLYLVAVEEGVYVGEESLAPNTKVRLYHGKRFKIGQTSFMYVEKDVNRF